MLLNYQSVLAQLRNRHSVSKRVSCARWTLSGAGVLRLVGLEQGRVGGEETHDVGTQDVPAAEGAAFH